jgi:hypothetical protein
VNCPSFVRDHIAAKARELRQAHADSPIAVAVIERLTTDPRMRRVWDELTKQRRKEHRRTGEPLHKVAQRFASAGIDERAAATGLLEQAFNHGRLTLMLPQADQPDRPFEVVAKTLRDVARQQGRDQASQTLAKRLEAEADAIEGIIVAAYDPAEAIAGGIAFYLQSVFGSPMYKTTAIIASVITKREITERKVRTWVGHKARSHPAKNK